MPLELGKLSLHERMYSSSSIGVRSDSQTAYSYKSQRKMIFSFQNYSNL